MSAPTACDIGFLDRAAAGDDELLHGLTGLINDVYAVAEAGLWQDGMQRVTVDELAGIVAAGELAVATAGDEIVGCIHLHPIDDGVNEFGILVAAPDRRGTGLGRSLIEFAEERSRADRVPTMRLELLVPKEGEHPTKLVLAGWYGRLGYEVVGIEAVEHGHPNLAPLLARPCEIQIREKALGSVR